MRAALFLLPLLLLVSCASLCSAAARPHSHPPLRWGTVGHWMTGALAQPYLSADAARAAKNLLPPEAEGDLASVASWADWTARDKYPWSGQLHYIDTPDWACNYMPERDCFGGEDGRPGACVDNAIQNYTATLAKGTAGHVELSEALMWLIHYVGDIHQPLHVSFASDMGGNQQVGTFCGATERPLHALWDTDIPERRVRLDFNGSRDDYMLHLEKELRFGRFAPHVAAWRRCEPATAQPLEACSIEWAQSSARYACDAAYVDTTGRAIQSGYDLCEPYYQRALPIVEERMVQAGVRLANVLNNLFRVGGPMHRYTVEPEEFQKRRQQEEGKAAKKILTE